MVRVMVQTAHKYWSRISISRAISSDPFSSWDETSFGCHFNKLCGSRGKLQLCKKDMLHLCPHLYTFSDIANGIGCSRSDLPFLNFVHLQCSVNLQHDAHLTRGVQIYLYIPLTYPTNQTHLPKYNYCAMASDCYSWGRCLNSQDMTHSCK